MKFIAHIREDGTEQSVKMHLDNVAWYSELCAEKIGLGACGRLVGQLHDVGKYSNNFTEYIKTVVANHELHIKGPDHSTAGAILLLSRLTSNSTSIEILTAQILAETILGHHGGLGDIVDGEGKSPFLQRIEKLNNNKEYGCSYNEAIENFSKFYDLTEIDALLREAAKEIASLFRKTQFNNAEYIVGLVCKYLFSCLIDGDRYDTATFMDGIKMKSIENNLAIWDQLGKEFELKIKSFDHSTHINLLRKKISDSCYERANCDVGVYTLNCPTGSGKTLASFRWALAHAKAKRKNRIFYIVPFLAIIEQNAQEIRKMFPHINTDNIIQEIHSGKELDDSMDTDSTKCPLGKKYADLMTERLEAPIIFTTLVRFLNTFFASGTKNIRGIHRFTNSIIIFDEIQSLNPQFIQIFNELIEFLTKTCKATVLLSTATQPLLDKVHSLGDHQLSSITLAPDSELSCCNDQLRKEFKRVEFYDITNKNRKMTTEEIAELVWKEAKGTGNVLVVLNTKKAVENLYLKVKELFNADLAKENFALQVLTTNIYPKDRQKRIYDIKQNLAKQKKMIVISTQLIEAGVDVSFDVVFRSVAGLDSIIQSGGRCNRHGNNTTGKLGKVYIINPEDENVNSLYDIKLGQAATNKLLLVDSKEYGGDLATSVVIETYFKWYLLEQSKRKYTIDVGNNYKIPLYNLLANNKQLCYEFEKANKANYPNYTLFLHQSFATAAARFKAITDYGISVVVLTDESSGLLEKMQYSGSIEKAKLYKRALGAFSVNISPEYFEQLKPAITCYEKYEVFVLDSACYDSVLGVKNMLSQKILII